MAGHESTAISSFSRSSSGQNRYLSSESVLQKILLSNSSGRSIYLRTIFTILFFFSVFAIFGIYNFVDGSPRTPPSPKCIVFLTFFAIQAVIGLAGMALPWNILLYPFRRVLGGTKQDVEVQNFSYERNLYTLGFYNDGGNPAPLLKRTFTVLKTTMKHTNSFRVIGARKGTESAPKEVETISSPIRPNTNQNARLNSQRSTASKVSRNASTASMPSRRPRGGSQRGQRPQTPSILRITHPMESLTVHQANNKLCMGLDYVSVSVTRRPTGASDRSYQTEEIDIDPEKEIANTLRKLEGLSTIGEVQSFYIVDDDDDDDGGVAITEDVPELSDGESARSSLRKSGLTSSQPQPHNAEGNEKTGGSVEENTHSSTQASTGTTVEVDAINTEEKIPAATASIPQSRSDSVSSLYSNFSYVDPSRIPLSMNPSSENLEQASKSQTT